MNKRNRIGPRLGPCGTSHLISLADDILPLAEQNLLSILEVRLEPLHVSHSPLYRTVQALIASLHDQQLVSKVF